MYHVHVDNRVPYWIYSNRQDDGTMRGPIDGVGADGNGGCRQAARCRSRRASDAADVEAEAVARRPGAPRRGGNTSGTRRRAGDLGGRRNAARATNRPLRFNRPQQFAGGGRGGGNQLQWQPNIGGCESGFTIPDPTDANIVYASAATATR